MNILDEAGAALLDEGGAFITDEAGAEAIRRGTARAGVMIVPRAVAGTPD